MTGLEIFLSGTTAALGVLLGLLLSAYLPAYAKEKAKNLATKEDVAAITGQVENVRAEFSKQSALLERRRAVYERISDSLRIFIAGHGATECQQNAFHSAYAACWLWAPDDVLSNLNQFITMQQENHQAAGTHSQEEMKHLYGQIIVGMRKDVGFPQTALTEMEYRFVQF
ncbi:MAG: hypothetical protein CMP06_00580 [Xanthomonadales bacterium]|nr:hypothetical protein [Xanthomonadales bacterium]